MLELDNRDPRLQIHHISKRRQNEKQEFSLTWIGLLFLSLILAACGSASSNESGFPTGKFIKSGTTNYGLMFNEDGTFSVFQGSTTFVGGTYRVEGASLTSTT
jgi:hypothetical protein